MVDNLGRCKICKGWRPNTPTFLPVNDVLREALPFLLRQPIVLPSVVFTRVSIQGDLRERSLPTDQFRSLKILRDDIDTFIDACQMASRQREAV
jgi:hypothetical protein